jgi:TolB-like protein
MPNKLSQFWQELKRRKVIRTITVYAAAAFVILELVSMSEEPFGLPEWTFVLAVILLSIGFLIAIILSWIYDIHPEGGMVKTEPVDKVSAEEIPKSSNSWKIASYISFVVIVALIVINVIPRINLSSKKEILDKSIAVLPFKSLSDDPEKQYLADGTMDAILLHLSRIEDLRVMARTSVQQYRETDKTATEICQELDVAYLLEGSFQKYGDQAKLIVQLIQPGMEGHIWANEYDREWKDIFTVQSEVAQLVAKELQAVITPEEKQLIEKIPTTNLTAYDFYQRGIEEIWNDKTEKAEDLFKKALEYDSTYALAYTGLAWVYLGKHWEDTYFSTGHLDSVLLLTDIALSYDNQLSEAYILRGSYYSQVGNPEQTILELDKAIKLNPNNGVAYAIKGATYSNYNLSLVKSIENSLKAVTLDRGEGLHDLLFLVGWTYLEAGFIDKAKYYYSEALKLDGDSVDYYNNLGIIEGMNGNYRNAIEFRLKGYAIDTNNTYTIRGLGADYLSLGQYKESLKYYKRWINALGNLPEYDLHRIGYAYWQNGYTEEAEYYFDIQIEYSNKEIELGRPEGQSLNVYYDLASIYAFREENDNAFENLRIFNQVKIINFGRMNLIKNDPLFDNIRDEPEFQQIVRDVEAKYQAEHERVRKWLEENDML